MLQIAALCLLVWAAAASSLALHRERSVFSAHGQSTSAKWLVWLYPLPFVLPLLDRSLVWFFFFPLPLSAACFVPAMVLAVQNRRRFEGSGDDRAKAAAAAVDYVITAGTLGIIATFLLTAFLWMRHR